jgi:hypothetical protein
MQPDWWSIGAAAIATLLAPVIALQVSKLLQDRAEKTRLKQYVFGTLMSNRHALISEDSVRCLNLIDTIFAEDKVVKDRWAELHNSYCDQRLSTLEGTRIREDKLRALLEAMSASVGLAKKFRSEDFARIYQPAGLVETHQLQALETKRRLQELLTSTTAPAAPPEQPANLVATLSPAVVQRG